MSFRLDLDRPIPDEVRRVAAEQIRAALAALHDPGALGLGETVHDVRKRCKRGRALVRLARPGLGREYRRANAGMRDAAAELGPLRDADALLGTFETLVLTVAQDRPPDDGLTAVRDALASRAAAEAGSDASDGIERAATLLSEVERRIERWDIEDRRRLIVSGAAETYRRGRRSFRASRGEANDRALHEWRKRAKYGWHHVQLLRDAAPSVLAPLAQRMKDLADALGDDHDLALLRTGIAADRGGLGGEEPVAEALALIDRTRADLQDRAWRLGARLYAEPPAAYADRIRRYWRAWQAVGGERPAGEIADLADLPA